jgi:hypothetical protein
MSQVANSASLPTGGFSDGDGSNLLAPAQASAMRLLMRGISNLHMALAMLSGTHLILDVTR